MASHFIDTPPAGTLCDFCSHPADGSIRVALPMGGSHAYRACAVHIPFVHDPSVDSVRAMWATQIERNENRASRTRVRDSFRAAVAMSARWDFIGEDLCERMEDMPLFGPSYIRRLFLH